jgi:RNA polymerase sigma factor (sigma-70 family)
MNVCQDHIRRKSRQPLISSADDAEETLETGEPVFDVTAKWMLLEIERAVNSLPETERAAVELHYTQGLSYREMAEVLRCPAGTIKARVHDAITKLRRKLRHLVEEVD